MKHPPHLRRSLFRNALVKTVFSLGHEVYLVGGYLRDFIALGSRPRDLDFVAKGDLGKISRDVALSLGGRVVELKKERMLRVCLEGGVNIDLSPLAGNLSEDLSARDFTVNAMAWSPRTGLVDPHGGIADISRGLIRFVKRDNLRQDPLRLLRAYRFAAQMGWAIGPTTREAIKSLSSFIKEPAPERITLELFQLLNASAPGRALNHALRDGVLAGIISLTYSKLEKNVKSLSKIDENLEKLPQRFFSRAMPQGLSYRGLVRLEGLLQGSGLGRSRLRLSREITERVVLAQALLKRFQGIQRLNMGEVFELFSEAGDATPDLLALSGKMDRLGDALKFQRIHSRGLLNATEIMHETGLLPGPAVGRLLRESRKLQFEGRLRNSEQARRWLRRSAQII